MLENTSQTSYCSLSFVPSHTFHLVSVYLFIYVRLDMVAYICNVSTCKVKAEGQKFKVILGFIVRLFLGNNLYMLIY